MTTSAATITKSLLDIVVLGDAYEHGNELEESLLNLLISLDPVELSALPRAFSNTIRLMSDDLVRWRTLGDLAVRLDITEALPAILDDLALQRDVHQAANALTLASNPSVSPASRSRARTMVEAIRLNSSSRMLGIRAGGTDPQSDLEWILSSQLWPGTATPEQLAEVSPLVFIARDPEHTESGWHLAAAIARAGGRIRWVSIDTSAEPTPWASGDCPFVHWSGTHVGTWRRLVGRLGNLNTLPAPAALEDEMDLSRFIHKLEHHLPAEGSFERSPRTVTALPRAFSPEVLEEGAYDAAEMAYLGASSRSSLTRMAKEGLTPSHADVNRWRFNQLVAIRIASSFRARGMRLSIPTNRLVAQLSDIAAANAEYHVGIGTDGEVYLDDGEGYKNARTDQQTIGDVLAIDEAFRPYELGAGKIPGLLRPGRYTTVHPVTLGGTPCIENRRISARALALAVHGGGESKLIRSAFPELTAAQIADGVTVGDGILSQVS